MTNKTPAAVRVRPPLKASDPGYELIPQRFQRSMVHVTTPSNLAIDVPQGRKLFVFDRVFSESIDQQGIWDYLSDSVGSFLQGYNVSILAYGQSGAGKSYTMGTSGPNEQHDPTAMGKPPFFSCLPLITGTYTNAEIPPITRCHPTRIPSSFRQAGSPKGEPQ